MQTEVTISRSLFRDLRNQAGNWRRSFTMIWNASPYYTTYWSILLVIQGLLPGALVYLIKLVVDSMVVAVNAKGDWAVLKPALFYTAAMALVMLLIELFQALLEMVRAAQAELIQDHIKGLVHTQAAALDLSHFESSEYHDRLEQATSDGAARPLSLLESFGGVIQNSITLLVMGGLLFQYSTWLPLLLLITTLPAFLVMLRFDREYHRWWKGTTPTRRWIQYFDTMLTHSQAVTEMRAFGLNPSFQKQYQDLRSKLRADKLSQTRRLSIAKVCAGTVSLLMLGAALLWMGRGALNGQVTLGDVALFYQAFSRGQSLVKTLFGSVGQMIKNSLFVTVLFEFLDLTPRIVEASEPKFAPTSLRIGINIDNITFKYPETDRYIFRDFSMFIPAGSVVALVGENGAGKTSLIKLIGRYYDPEEGSVRFDGRDIREFGLDELRRFLTITFQMPLNYHATVAESIAMGDVSVVPDRNKIESAARSAGASEFIEQLPQGYDTLLGRVLANGAELSGGQWQRLALARAYYRKAPVVLLDEPTSFMDSWSESDWFDRLRNLVAGRTTLVITHRFTIAMRADLIIVMDEGQIVEQGTHSELLIMNGLYARSWNEQMRTAIIHGEASERSGSELPDPSSEVGIDQNHADTAFTSKF